jgi:sugar/nucleoside kinase (ribokinase family)
LLSAGCVYRVAVLVVLGDLVEDVVVELGGPVALASDTPARIHRRRGGSAANVAAAAGALGAQVRFVGQVGEDSTGEVLVADLASAGVDVRHVRRAGRTATIVVLVDAAGERTMLVDPGAARDLDTADPGWLDDATVLHLTLYSLLEEPVATTSRELAAMARRAGVPVSVDLSSVGLIEAAGADDVRARVEAIGPSVVFANADEARLLQIDASFAGVPTFVKAGAAPATVFPMAGPGVEVPALVVGQPVDTTGAGDAFAAGVLTHPGWSDDLVAACTAGHRSAHALLASRLQSPMRPL